MAKASQKQHYTQQKESGCGNCLGRHSDHFEIHKLSLYCHSINGNVSIQLPIKCLTNNSVNNKTMTTIIEALLISFKALFYWFCVDQTIKKYKCILETEDVSWLRQEPLFFHCQIEYSFLFSKILQSIYSNEQ